MKEHNLYNIDKAVPVPLYYQIKQSILAAIQEGQLKGGDMLPTELDFCVNCGISRPTIRQALSELVTEGYLYRLKGKGTFVAQPKIDARFLNKLQSFNQEMTQKGLVPSTQVLSVQTIEGKSSINKLLNIPAGEKLLYLERVRYTDGEPIVYLETYLPNTLLGGLAQEDFTHKSLYSLLEEKYNLRVEKVQREIEAVNATTHVAGLLEISKGKAICLVTTVAYAGDMMPVEYSVARYRGDRNKFSVELYR
ncbi:GntR family transcriptional regulator [Ruminococcaceae bacterium OttesenSCG-928-A16]|nr:GntR family transcriptional regulator [Ruminococcaceae bacterium OttesenSCG-928-A16]